MADDFHEISSLIFLTLGKNLLSVAVAIGALRVKMPEKDRKLIFFFYFILDWFSPFNSLSAY